MRRIALLAVVIAVCGFGHAEAAIEFSDDFNDGDADGWAFPYNSGWNQAPGEWSVQDGVLVQTTGSDFLVGLVEDMVFSDQQVETDVQTQGYGGVTLWHHDRDNFATVFAYPFSAGIRVVVVVDGVGTPTNYGHRTRHNTWYDLRVDADSTTGELGIYLDNVHVANHQTNSLYRSGLSGVVSGNGLNHFDNFRVTTAAIPEPTALIVWSFLAFCGVAYAHCRMRRR